MKIFSPGIKSQNLGVESNSTRRGFLKVAAAAICLSTFPAMAKNLAFTPERNLNLYNTHTGEGLRVAYWVQGSYVPDAVTQLNKLMRDHRTNEIAQIDNSLFDLLHILHTKLEGKQAFHIISGFRSLTSNTLLASHGSGVAKASLHMRGQAIDVRLPQCELAVLRKSALSLRAGGVGYYPDSNFVHIDIGRVRSW